MKIKRCMDKKECCNIWLFIGHGTIHMTRSFGKMLLLRTMPDTVHQYFDRKLLHKLIKQDEDILSSKIFLFLLLLIESLAETRMIRYMSEICEEEDRQTLQTDE